MNILNMNILNINISNINILSILLVSGSIISNINATNLNTINNIVNIPGITNTSISNDQVQNNINDHDEIAKDLFAKIYEIKNFKDIDDITKLDKILTEVLESNKNDEQYSNKLFLKYLVYTCMQNCLTSDTYFKIINGAFNTNYLIYGIKDARQRKKSFDYLRYYYTELASHYDNKSYKEYVEKLKKYTEHKYQITREEINQFVIENNNLFINAKKQRFKYVQTLLKNMINELSAKYEVNYEKIFKSLLPEESCQNFSEDKYSYQYMIINNLFIMVKKCIKNKFIPKKKII